MKITYKVLETFTSTSNMTTQGGKATSGQVSLICIIRSSKFSNTPIARHCVYLLTLYITLPSSSLNIQIQLSFNYSSPFVLTPDNVPCCSHFIHPRVFLLAKCHPCPCLHYPCILFHLYSWAVHLTIPDRINDPSRKRVKCPAQFNWTICHCSCSSPLQVQCTCIISSLLAFTTLHFSLTFHSLFTHWPFSSPKLFITGHHHGWLV